MKQESSKRTLIIEAAIEEFQSNGFERASMDRISERASVSKRTVYKHFECKITLFGKVIDEMTARMKDPAPVQFNPDLPVREQLLSLGHHKGKLLQSKQFMQLVRIAMSETLRDPCLAKALNQRSDGVGEYAQFFRDAVASGLLSADDPAKVEGQFIGLIKSKAFWPSIFSGEVPAAPEMEKVIEEAADVIVSAYGARLSAVS
ncbi:MAG: TetR/AcrR family transcriptional regulator [Pseudomonadota bacterium]